MTKCNNLNCGYCDGLSQDEYTDDYPHEDFFESDIHLSRTTDGGCRGYGIERKVIIGCPKCGNVFIEID